MAKATSVFATKWEDPYFLRLSAPAKTVWDCFVTGHERPSGIYVRDLRTVAHYCRLQEDEVHHIVVAEGIRNIRYDEETCAVFVVNKFHYQLRTGGSPILYAKAIINDYYSTPKPERYWTEFRARYDDFIRSSDKLSNFFLSIDAGLEFEPEGKPTPDVHTDTDLEDSIQGMLRRYTKELDRAEAEKVLRLYDHLTRNKRTGEPRSLKTRVRVLRTLEGYGAEDVAYACASMWDARKSINPNSFAAMVRSAVDMRHKLEGSI